jgi:O-succinylbenzoate synthase
VKHIRGMAVRTSLQKRIFLFSFNARTSRGPMKDRMSWFFKVWDESAPEVVGWGECGPLAGLSSELTPEFDAILESCLNQINHSALSIQQVHEGCESLTKLNALLSSIGLPVDLNTHSSIKFALETAFLDLHHGGERIVFDNSFVKGQPIPINGLIWMGGLDFMLQQVEIKIRDGFRCIKLKVGGLDFEKECDILQYVRRKYFRDNIIIRLDANGALKPDDAMYKLNELSKFGIHSIEQPFKKGSDRLPELCRKSPIPVALDEELIGVNNRKDKIELLDHIKPQFIILKPALHGGLYGCEEWIEAANEKNIEWWITSALESNIGLNAIAQFTANHKVEMHQGLGTGSIYENNIPSPLRVDKEYLKYGKGEWDLNDQENPTFN